jgi:hypothetical protein
LAYKHLEVEYLTPSSYCHTSTKHTLTLQKAEGFFFFILFLNYCLLSYVLPYIGIGNV